MAWPEITKSIKDSGVIDLEIYMIGNRTFEFNIVPLDFDWDASLDGSQPSEKEKQWGAIMGPIDQPFTDANGKQLPSQVMKSIFKFTRHKSSISYVATRSDAVKDMLWMANVSEKDVVYDLGSGDGRIVIAAVRDFNASRAIGIESNHERIKESWENARKAQVTDRVDFIEGDLFTNDFSHASVVTMFLGHQPNIRLRPKIFRTLEPGSRIVSHQFGMGEWKPDKTHIVRTVYMGMYGTLFNPFSSNPRVPDYTGNENRNPTNDRIFMWVLPAHVAGVWRGKINTSQGTQELKLILHQRLSEVTGKLILTGQNDMEGNMSVDLWGNHLRFWIRGLRFDGHVHDNMISGTLAITEQGQVQEFLLQAQRDEVDYTGTWQWPPDSEESSFIFSIEKLDGCLNATYQDRNQILPVHDFYDFGGGFYFTLLIDHTEKHTTDIKEHIVSSTYETDGALWLIGEGIIDNGQLIGEIDFHGDSSVIPCKLSLSQLISSRFQDGSYWWTPSLIKP
jgi:L-rhamnose mutarotase